MKVVDLFGVGVPVAAFEFLAIGELVKDGVNGVIFKDGIDLGEALKVCGFRFSSPSCNNVQANHCNRDCLIHPLRGSSSY